VPVSVKYRVSGVAAGGGLGDVGLGLGLGLGDGEVGLGLGLGLGDGDVVLGLGDGEPVGWYSYAPLSS
jgi:hypothetical protein